MSVFIYSFIFPRESEEKNEKIQVDDRHVPERSFEQEKQNDVREISGTVSGVTSSLVITMENNPPYISFRSCSDKNSQV